MATPTNLPPGSQRLPLADEIQKALEPHGLLIKKDPEVYKDFLKRGIE